VGHPSHSRKSESHIKFKELQMPRARTPKAKAVATGRVLHDPKRFRERTEPTIDTPLGKPPTWLKKNGEREAWATLSAEIPWLNSSNRTLVALACGILGRLIDGEEIGVKALNLLRQMLNSMGATPSDVSKVKMPEHEVPDDPSKKYF
jgi:hypothetical protein